MQLLYEITFLLTPEDRNGRIFGCAALTVACVANQQLGAEFCLRDRTWDGISGICRCGQRGQNAQNDENSRNVIVDHVYAAHCSSAHGPVTRPTRGNHLKHDAVRLVAQDGADRWRGASVMPPSPGTKSPRGRVHQILPPACAALRTARTIRLWAPQRHKLPASPIRTSASLGCWMRSSSALANMIMPAMQ